MRHKHWSSHFGKLAFYFDSSKGNQMLKTNNVQSRSESAIQNANTFSQEIQYSMCAITGHVLHLNLYFTLGWFRLCKACSAFSSTLLIQWLILRIQRSWNQLHYDEYFLQEALDRYHLYNDKYFLYYSLCLYNVYYLYYDESFFRSR